MFNGIDRMKGNIYPILKPGNWVGVESGAVNMPFIGSEEKPEVIVGFGYETPEDYVFLTGLDAERMGENAFNKLIEQAYANIDAMHLEFTLIEKLDNQVLTASGKAFSSEAILSKKHMMEAHRILNSKELFVSIPRRTCLMVTSRDVSDSIFSKFTYLHSVAWHESDYGNAPITNMIFVVKDGVTIGTITAED